MPEIPENQILWNNILKRMQAKYPARGGMVDQALLLTEKLERNTYVRVAHT